MWTTRLMVLGLVRWLGPAHGYLIRAELENWATPDTVTDIKVGSIYHALRKLTTDGMIEIVATESVAERPERTTFQITVAGEKEFQHVLREKMWDFTVDTNTFELLWGFAVVLGQKEIMAMLEKRADRLFENIDSIAQVMAATTGDYESAISGANNKDDDDCVAYAPPHVRAMLRRRTNLLATDAEWCEQMLADLASGEITLGPDLNAEHSAAWRDAIAQNVYKNIKAKALRKST